MYDVTSKKASEFIDHQEILDTLAYADQNKDNLELVDALIKKAADGLKQFFSFISLISRNGHKRGKLNYQFFKLHLFKILSLFF